PARPRGRRRGPHRFLVGLVWARRGDVDGDDRQAHRVRLSLQERAAHGVHGHAIVRLVHGREQADDLDPRVLSQHVQRPGTVLAAAPGEQDPPAGRGRGATASAVSTCSTARGGNAPAKIRGCRIPARISRLSTTRGPGRLKYCEPSTAYTCPRRTARRAAHPSRARRSGTSWRGRGRAKPQPGSPGTAGARARTPGPP